MMTPEERTAAEELLEEVTVALKAFDAAKENSLEETPSRLYRSSIDLRRQLSEDAVNRSLTESMNSRRSDCSESLAVEPSAAASRDGQSADRGTRPERRRPDDDLNEFTLSPLARLLICGVCLLMWVVPPGLTYAPFDLSLLLFLRFVPIFIVGGSLCGYTMRGTILGMGLFFVLMAADSLSLLMWDINQVVAVAFKPVRHVTNLANFLYLFGAAGLLVSGAATLALRRDKHQAYERYLRLSLQALMAVQLALAIELGYTSLRHFTGADRNHLDMTTLTIAPHKSFRSR
jgi:hypothetical protein